ncbi:biopolymer transporter ExbD, partial [Acidithiobacillus caldus]|nr:biopolymer transporter ExbD [Acidithiobacillus caldus]
DAAQEAGLTRISFATLTSSH